jgi:CheY-like chemotaxis protein
MNDAGIGVVVVDDHDDMVEILCEALAHVGARPRGFASAREALAAIRADPPDVVITDLAMPETSGAELASILRSDTSTSAIPLIAISGRIEPYVDIVRLFDAYLCKPVDPLLVASLAELLARRTGSRPRSGTYRIVRKDLARALPPAASRTRSTG